MRNFFPVAFVVTERERENLADRLRIREIVCLKAWWEPVEAFGPKNTLTGCSSASYPPSTGSFECGCRLTRAWNGSELRFSIPREKRRARLGERGVGEQPGLG